MWIKTIPIETASGSLKRQYEAAIERAGKVWNLVVSMSLKPEVLRTSIQLYKTLMMGPSGLTRAQREMIAVAVSRVNNCYY
ncbi:MAG: carboxymuconolactone decarboxylase family protein [Chloroflexi bacterium]|nr:carboxymuconolactone decarboxylase family protein [Chloroflexota bacterium]